jgi:hypothetical protein
MAFGEKCGVPAKDERTLQNVIFISNRFYAKPHASH